MNTFAPFFSSRSVIGLALASDPCTAKPWFSSTSAIPDMPMPPMPTKWIAPMSCGSRVSPFMRFFPFSARRSTSAARCSVASGRPAPRLACAIARAPSGSARMAAMVPASRSGVISASRSMKAPPASTSPRAFAA